MSEAGSETEARRIATEARDRARFEEDALALADRELALDVARVPSPR